MNDRDKSQAYRGYYITHNVINDEFHASKDGYHVCSRKTLDEVKSEIDLLLDGDGA